MVVGFSGLLGAALHAQVTYEPYAFSLFAGSPGNLGGNDGTGGGARFNAPQGAAVDSNGNVYIADTGNCTIRKITAAGVVTTLAGLAGVDGSDDGTGSDARFELPQDVAVDNAGNIYVGDTGNYTIRKITPGGVVTTFAGAAHMPGSDDGLDGAARFGYPIGVSVDNSGNVYVADLGNNTIRMITSAGFVSTLAGLAGTPGSTDGTGPNARFTAPSHVAWDKTTGWLYVSDTANHTIRKITAGGVVTTVAGFAGVMGSADGTGSAARFDGPRGLGVDIFGNVYVASSNSHTIRKIRPGGIVTTLAGSPGVAGSTDGFGGSVRFFSPYGLAVDGAGHLFIAEDNNYITRLGVPGSEALTIKISPGSSVGKRLLTGRAFPNVMVDIGQTGTIGTAFQPLVTVQADANGVFQYEDTSSIKRFYHATVNGG